MFVLGITGGIGSGKSTVAEILKSKGITVLDADEISKNVTSAGGEAMKYIIDTFPPECVLEDGSLNRKYMADVVFNDKKNLDKLSLIVHKAVFEVIDKQIIDLRNAGVKVVALDVPLPVKDGFIDKCNYIFSVETPENIRIERLIRRGMTKSDATRRIAVQLPVEAYREISDEVIDNSGDYEYLSHQVDIKVGKILRDRGINYPGIK